MHLNIVPYVVQYTKHSNSFPQSTDQNLVIS
jgi:hypothetical protein